MSTEQASPMILTIDTSDDFVYVYNSIDELLADGSICGRAGKEYGAFEFFDCAGRRLVAGYDRRWRLRILTPDGPGDPGLILNRVHNWLDRLRCFIKDNPDEFQVAGLTLKDALSCVPDLSEASDLETAMRTLADHSPREEPRTLRNIPRIVIKSLSAKGKSKCGNPFSCVCRISRRC